MQLGGVDFIAAVVAPGGGKPALLNSSAEGGLADADGVRGGAESVRHGVRRHGAGAGLRRLLLTIVEQIALALQHVC